jgi:hypothetical protein
MASSGKEGQGDHDRDNMIERETNERRRKEEKSDLVEECDEYRRCAEWGEKVP